LWNIVEKSERDAMTESKIGRDFETYFKEFLILGKSENSGIHQRD
jgi:hypothetical protein